MAGVLSWVEMTSSRPSPFRSPVVTLSTRKSARLKGNESGGAAGGVTRKSTFCTEELEPSVTDTEAVAGPTSQRLGDARSQPPAAPGPWAGDPMVTYDGPEIFMTWTWPPSAS